ncbi:MAG: response regulator receiver protein [Bacteroidota bacterium]|jgi:CheY-like chemotaxis protein|nr:response regulator receiver protein [Bacteroidota bacterium]
MNCFLIDDDPDDQEIFCMALDEIGESVKCEFASDGVEAIKKLTEGNYKPDLIFIDMNMPRMNGNTCLQEIKKIEGMQSVPVYMYSTSAEPEAVAATKKSGAAGFIVKPTSVSELSETLKFCLRNNV